jgi:hypothetical protein
MRIGHSLTVYFRELEQPDLMIQWGGHKKRKRLRPGTLKVDWKRDDSRNEGQWRLHHVWLMGSYVHASTSSSISTTLFERDTWAQHTPDWVYALVDQSHPVPEWQRVSQVMGVS